MSRRQYCHVGGNIAGNTAAISRQYSGNIAGDMAILPATWQYCRGPTYL